MRKRSGIVGRWVALLIVTLLVIPLLGWTSFPIFTDRSAIKSTPIPETAAQLSLSSQASPAGSDEAGGDLFMGNLHFKNGGPPCMGCHNVGSNGLLGGGAMGPDLTNVSDRRSQAEIASILSNNGPFISPVMQPILAEHPLTESEQADLIAFLNSSVGQPVSNREILVIGLSLAGFSAAVILVGFVYRRRLRGVRKPLLKKAQYENR